MEHRGYALKLTSVKHPTIRPPGYKRFIRLSGLGDNYALEAIRHRILRNTTRQPAMPEPTRRFTRGRLRNTVKRGKRITGLRALYYRYLYLLGFLPRKYPYNRRTHAILRQDILKMDRISAQTVLLWEHRIDTQGQLPSFRITIQEQQAQAIAQRDVLRNELRRLRRENEPDQEQIKEVKGKVAELTRSLAKYRRELSLCDEITERSADMAARLREAERQTTPQNDPTKEGKPHERRR